MPAFAAAVARRRPPLRLAFSGIGFFALSCAATASPESGSAGTTTPSAPNTTAVATTSASGVSAAAPTSVAQVPTAVTAGGGLVATPGECVNGVLEAVLQGGTEALEVRLAATSLDPTLPVEGPAQRIAVPAGAEVEVALPIDAAVGMCGIVILESTPLPAPAQLEPAEFAPGNPAEIAAATGSTEFRLTSCESAVAVVEVRNPTPSERAVSVAVTWLRGDGTTLAESAAYEFHPIPAAATVTLPYAPRTPLPAEPGGCRAEMAFDLPLEEAPLP